jgi:hypothetical protein
LGFDIWVSFVIWALKFGFLKQPFPQKYREKRGISLFSATSNMTEVIGGEP